LLSVKTIIISGASACVELGLYEEAVTWCDKGLAVSLYNIFVLSISRYNYTQTKKTVNTENISGMFIVF